MTIATKNGAIIVKDGLLAENCGCCGGWYCKTAEIPLSVAVSGWLSNAECVAGSDVSEFFRSTYAFGNYIHEFNGTHATTELCGEATAVKDTYNPFQAGGRGLPLGGTMYVRTWLSNLNLSNAVSCQSGFVSRKVTVSLDYRFRESVSGEIRLLYSGGVESACFDLNSLPQSGSWVSGQSFSVPVNGGTYANGSSMLCPFPTLNISVSFQ